MRGREGVRVMQSEAVSTVPDLNVLHRIKHLLMRPWVAMSGYGTQQIDMQACTHTHTKSLPARLSCTFLATAI